MGRKSKKTTEAGQSSSEGSQVSTAAKGAAGAGGKSYPSSGDSPRTDSHKEKTQKKQKQSTVVTGGGPDSGKSKQKTNGRDSSEEMKKQGTKQKAKSSRGGASAKSKVANGGCCSLFCCMTVLSVLVAVVAAAGYAGYMAYPDESMQFLESADTELRLLYRSARDIASRKLDEILVAVGQKTPDKTEPVQRPTERVIRENVPEDDADEERMVRENVPEDDADEERMVRENVPEDDADEERVAREHFPEEEAVVKEHVPEVHEEKKPPEEKTDVPTESRMDETVEGRDVRSESEADTGVAEERSLEKDLEEETVSEECTSETVEEELTEEEVVEDEEEQAKEVKHWEMEQEEKVKGEAGSNDEELKEFLDSPPNESITTDAPTKSNDDGDAQVVSEQVEERREDVPVAKEHDVPKQQVPEPEVVHLEVPEPEIPRVVVPAEDALKPEVLHAEDAILDVAEENLAEEPLGTQAPVEPEAPVATEHLGAAAQFEAPMKKEEPEQRVAFEGSDAAETETSDRVLEYSDREGFVKEMMHPVVEEIQADIPASEGVPADARAGEEQAFQPISPVAETESQQHKTGDGIEVEPSTVESAETQASSEFHPQEDAGHKQHEERFESREAAAEETVAESSYAKSVVDELESQLDYLEGVANVAPREAIEMYNHILGVVPENPRAVIGKAYALGVTADVEQNDVALEQSISEYLKVFSLPSVPKPLMVAAARACAEKQTLRGWGISAAQTLKSVVAMYPDDLELYNELGQKYVMNGAYEEARATFKEILNKNPTDAFAMLNLGYIMKLVDKDLGHSLDLMKTGLMTVPITDLKFYVELGESLTRTGRQNEALEVYQLAVDRKLLTSVWQRSWYNVDGLTRRPLWTSEETHNMINLQMLEDFWTVIRDEAVGILSNKSELFQTDNRDVIDSGEMKHLKLFVNGRKMTENCDAALKTCSLLDAFSDATECKQCEVRISMMQPGLHTWPHCGPTNSRLTAQLPLIVDPQTRIRIADQTRTYVSGRFLIFDDSFEQELWLAGESFQLLLTVEMWHPDLSGELRKTLGPL